MKKVFLFFSAFVPMYFLIFLSLSLEIINGNQTFNVLNTTCFSLCIVQIIIGIIGLLLVLSSSSMEYEIEIVGKKNITDQHFLGYFSLFVLFALTLDLAKVSMFVDYVVILIFIGVVYITNNLFYINPFLNILGFGLYEIKFKKNNKTITARIFHKGELTIGEKYNIEAKSRNFIFLED